MTEPIRPEDYPYVGPDGKRVDVEKLFPVGSPNTERIAKMAKEMLPSLVGALNDGYAGVIREGKFFTGDFPEAALNTARVKIDFEVRSVPLVLLLSTIETLERATGINATTVFITLLSDAAHAYLTGALLPVLEIGFKDKDQEVVDTVQRTKLFLSAVSSRVLRRMLVRETIEGRPRFSRASALNTHDPGDRRLDVMLEYRYHPKDTAAKPGCSCVECMAARAAAKKKEG